MTTGIALDGSGFEVLVGEQRVGQRRVLGAGDVDFLEGTAVRYARAVRLGTDPGVFAGLGRELYTWLDGDSRQLAGLLEAAGAPVVFEVAGPRSPSVRAWAVLRAPWELLARPDGGLLAEDGLTRLCVTRRLGARTGPGRLDGYRLGLAFMASAPRGQRELDYEAEEAAVLAAVGETRLDLLVEDTGDPVQLGSRLAEVGGMPVVHLSCHGRNTWRDPSLPASVPVLVMENDVGADRPTPAADLVRLLPTGATGTVGASPDPASTREVTPPRLVFVSACLTATGADATEHLPSGPGEKAGETSGDGPGAGAAGGEGGPVAHSLATALVTAGVPAVIGWDGSVDDEAATTFARHLYGWLADRKGLAVAVGDARRDMLTSDRERVRADWHLARLWLGPNGGGPVVAGTRKRRLGPATRGTKAFLAGKPEVPVATAEMFVGRRPELQQALRALRSGDRAGVLLHGQGRLGKSSLAARIADRFPDRSVAVVFGDYGPLAVLDAVRAAVKTDPEARDLIDTRLSEVRHRAEAIETVLIDLVTGPCAQAGDRHRPLLLIIDDLERILSPDGSGAHRVAPDHVAALRGVLLAFDPAETDSRLLLTSRYTFTLEGLEERLERVQLRPLSAVAQHKLQRRQQSDVPAARLTERAGLARRALDLSRGNPGLQDLIGARLVYGPEVSLARAEAAVTGMETYLGRGDLPADAEVRDYLERLALDALLDQAGPTHRDLLRAATLFDVPVPETVIERLADQVGGSPARLRGLGLLDSYPDPYDSAQLALAANPLTAARLAPLTPTERTALAGTCLDPLLAAWGGPAPNGRRATVLDLQLTRLALDAGDPAVTAACATGAVHALDRGHASHASRLGQDAVTLLDTHHRAVPLSLLRATASASLTDGDGATGQALLERAVTRNVASTDAADPDEDPLEIARALAEHARHLITRGEPARAEPLLRRARDLFDAGDSQGEAATAIGQIGDIVQARGDLDEALRIRREVELPVYERLGDVRSAAVTWGQIGDIVQARGDLDEALRIRREVQLPVYERLGDVRSAAVTWGRIGDIAFLKGEVREAAQLQERRLDANRKMGDLDGIAAACWDLARIHLAQQEYETALPELRESFQGLRKLRRADGLAVVGAVLGRLLLAAQEPGAARDVLQESHAAALRIGDGDLARQIADLLDQVPEGTEDQ